MILVCYTSFCRKSPYDVGPRTTASAAADAKAFLTQILLSYTRGKKRLFWALYRIGRVRKILDRTNTERLIHAFVSSRLDYCNSMLHMIDSKLSNRLQLLQNSAARLVTLTKKHEHITPVLFNLHWLPIYQRCKFKILLLTFKILHGKAPIYLSELITLSVPVAGLRSGDEIRFDESRYPCKTYNRRAFSIAAPELWNALPPHIRALPTLSAFKSALKTHLFRQHFH